jgi:hypothetical protein
MRRLLLLVIILLIGTPWFLFMNWLIDYLELRYGDIGLASGIGLVIGGVMVIVVIFALLGRISCILDWVKYYFLGLTNQRLVVARVRVSMFGLDLSSFASLTSFPLDRLPPISLGSKMLMRTIRIHDPGGPVVADFVTLGGLSNSRRVKEFVAALELKKGDLAPSQNA